MSVTNAREVWLKLIVNARAVPRSISLQSLLTILPSRVNGSFKRAVFILMERLAPYGGMKLDRRNAPLSERSRINAAYSIP